MTTPDLHLRTLYVLDSSGRITAVREPGRHPPPAFCLVRGATSCVWAVRADVSDDLNAKLDALAREETPNSDLRASPLHAERYESLLGSSVRSGPAFSFPDELPVDGDNVVSIDSVEPLQRHLRGWVADEISGRSPILAVLEEGHAVSVCCCARLSEVAAEAGLETAEAFRGRGFGPRVTLDWARAIRESGRTPLYSTSWDNHGSLAVARKLDLLPYASNWSIDAS